MTDLYITVIEYLSQLEMWQIIAMIGVIPAMVIYAKFKKNKPKLTMQDKIDKFQSEKRLIEQKELNIRKWSGLLCSVCAAAGCIHFGYRIGWFALAGSVCISILFWLFSTSVKRKWSKMNGWIDVAIIVCFIIFEISVFTGSYSAQNADSGNVLIKQERSRIIKRIETLEKGKTAISASMNKKELANAQYSNRMIDNQVEDLDGTLPSLPKNGEDEFFANMAIALGVDVELAKLYFFFGLSSLFMVGTALNNTRYNSYYSDESLGNYIGLLEKVEELIKAAGTVSGSAGSGEVSRSQKNPTTAKDDNFESNVGDVVKYLGGLPDKKPVTEKDILRNCLATTKDQAKLIRTKLISLGWIKKGGNGSATQYCKKTPLLAVVEDIKRPFWKLG